VYAIVLDWPGAGMTVTTRSLADKPGEIDIANVKLPGNKRKQQIIAVQFEALRWIDEIS